MDLQERVEKLLVAAAGLSQHLNKPYPQPLTSFKKEDIVHYVVPDRPNSIGRIKIMAVGKAELQVYHFSNPHITSGREVMYATDEPGAYYSPKFGNKLCLYVTEEEADRSAWYSQAVSSIEKAMAFIGNAGVDFGKAAAIGQQNPETETSGTGQPE